MKKILETCVRANLYINNLNTNSLFAEKFISFLLFGTFVGLLLWLK